MTDVLSRPTGPTAPAPGGVQDNPLRRLTVLGALVGVGAPLAALVGLWVVGLAAWFSSDGGAHGSTLSVLRVAGDTWLLAHGAHLEVGVGRGAYVVTASPLGLTLLCAGATFAIARWVAGYAEEVDEHDRPGVLARGVAALTGAHGLTALVLALVCGTPAAAPGPVSATLGAALVGGLAGGLGLVAGTGSAGVVRARLPVTLRSALLAGTAAAVLLTACGAVLTAASLAWHGQAAAAVADRLDLDAAGVTFSLLLGAAMAPNAALLGGAYLSGPGFAVGAGTVVSTAEVSLGPVPLVPLLAALPPDGPQPGWLAGLAAVPVLVGVAAALVAARTAPTRSWRRAALRGVLGGVVGAALLSVATAWAGGSVGPGRMARVGAPWWDLLLWNTAALGLGGLAGALGACWWARRRDVEEARPLARGPRQPRPISLYPQRLAPRVESRPGQGELSRDDLSATVRQRLAVRRERPAAAPPPGDGTDR